MSVPRLLLFSWSLSHWAVSFSDFGRSAASCACCRGPATPNKRKSLLLQARNLILYRRIAEVKANERKKALEEILYASVVQKFIDANISLTPSVTSDLSGKIDLWPDEDGKTCEASVP